MQITETQNGEFKAQSRSQQSFYDLRNEYDNEWTLGIWSKEEDEDDEQLVKSFPFWF